MKSNFKLTLLSGVAAVAATMMTTGAANATNGMLPHCVGTVKCGMGGAGSALAGAAVDAAINPALSGQMGNEYQVNMGWFWANVRGESTLSAVRGEQKSAAGDFANGSFGVNYKIDDTIAVNVSLAPGGGGASDWTNPRSNATGFPLAGTNEDEYVQYEMMYLQPSISYKYSDTATYGVGAILSRATMDTDSAQGSFQSSGGAGKEETFYGVGFQVGGVWQIGAGGSAAVNLRSPVWHEKAGVYDSLVFTDPIDTPAQAQAGIAFDMNPTTKLAIDYKWVGWSTTNTIGNQPSVQPTTSRGFGWDDQHIIMIGVQHEATDDLTVRAGVNHGNSPIDQGQVAGNFLFPAIVETHFTAGGSYKLGDGMVIGASGYVTPEAELYDDGSQFGASGSTGTHLAHQQYGFQLSFSNDF